MKKILFSIFIISYTLSLIGQDLDLNAVIPVDTSIIKGKLDNGLTYYIKQNKLPENRVEMRLVVNVGSILEDDNQAGLAHFFEHMCFNGTKNFEKNELVNFLEKTGVKFGPDLNAYTSFDETVYYFQIPSERISLIDTGLMILSDWAQNVSLDPVEIDKERGVITEEWRLGLGADDRMMKKFLPVILKNSKYAERLPIGDMDIINNFIPETLIKFYQDWYRPELMAIVVVGDINKNLIKEKIKEKFSDIPVHTSPRERENFSIPNNKEPLISVVSDVEAAYILIELSYKHDKIPEGTVGVYKDFIMRQLFNGMMSRRISEILQKPDAPFIHAGTYYGGFFGRIKDAYTSFAYCKDNMVKESLERLLIENERISRFGFTEGELERQKKEIISSYEQALKEKDKTKSNSFASEFTRNYLTNEPIPGIEKEYEYVQYFLPTIGLHDMNLLAKKWIIDSNIVVIITGPEKEGLKYPDVEELAVKISSSSSLAVSEYIDQVDNTPLISKVPKKGKITSEKYNQTFDFYEFSLSNGAKVIAKKTDYKNDEIILRAYSFGGESLYDLNDLYSSRFSDIITRISGVGNTDNVSLKKKLAGSTADISFSINDYDEVVSGSSSPKDIEDLFKLNYLYFTEPRMDSTAFNAFVSRLESQYKFVESDPKSVFNDTIMKVITSNDPRSVIILKPEHFAQIKLEKTYSIFKERFSNPSDYLFIYVGNLSIDTLKTMLEQYIASIPSSKNKEKWKNIEPEFPKGITNFNFYKGIDPQAAVYMFLDGPMEWNEKEKLNINFLKQVLSIRLREKVREDQGGTYGVRIRMSASDIPEPRYSWTIGFGCNPSKTDTLFNIVLDEIISMQQNGPTEDEMIKVKESFIRERETALKTNEFWISILQNHIIKKEPLMNLEDYKKNISDIKQEDIKKAANNYFHLDNYVHAVMLPEDMKP